MSEDATLNEAAKLVTAEYVIMWPEELFEPLDELSGKLRSSLSVLAKEFQANLNSALLVASIPYSMAVNSVIARRRQAHVAAARIRRIPLSPDEGLTDEDERIAAQVGEEALDVEINSKVGQRHLQEYTIRELEGALNHEPFKIASRELVLQTMVSVWSSFEVCASGAIEAMLNERPSLAQCLFSEERTRKHFPAKGLAVETLAAYDFDVSGSMGEIIIGAARLDNLPKLRDVVSVMLADEKELQQLLASPDLWGLWQKRHLIVHRRGVVDGSYRNRTADNVPVGERLRVPASVVHQSCELVRDAGIALLAAADRTLQK